LEEELSVITQEGKESGRKQDFGGMVGVSREDKEGKGGEKELGAVGGIESEGDSGEVERKGQVCLESAAREEDCPGFDGEKEGAGKGGEAVSGEIVGEEIAGENNA